MSGWLHKDHKTVQYFGTIATFGHMRESGVYSAHPDSSFELGSGGTFTFLRRHLDQLGYFAPSFRFSHIRLRTGRTMKITDRCTRGFCLVLTTLLLFGNSAALASTSTGDDISATLDQYEKTVFGETHSNRGQEARLKELEFNLFGKVKSGSRTVRAAAIAQALGMGGNLLMPPIAPQVDSRSSALPSAPTSATATSMPETAPASTAERGRNDSYSSSASADRVKEAIKHALVLYSQGNASQAEQAFRQVLVLDSKNSDAYYNLGVIAESRSDLPAALKNYKAALNCNPTDADLKDAVASTERKLQEKIAFEQRQHADQEQAAKDAQQEQLRNQLKPLVTEASAAYKAGNFDKAVSSLQAVARQAPNDPDVLYALAQAYRGKKSFEQARACLMRALALDPNNQSYKTAMNNVNRELAQAQSQSRSSDLAYGQSNDTRNGGGYGSGSGYNSGSGGRGMPSRYGNGDDTDSAGQTVPFDRRPQDIYSANGQGASQIDDLPQSSSDVTPFTSSGKPQRGAVYTSRGYGYGYGGGMGGNSRLRRAAVNGLTGAAMGAMTGAMFSGRGSRSQAAIKGALFGGALGLITGGLFP